VPPRDGLQRYTAPLLVTLGSPKWVVSILYLIPHDTNSENYSSLKGFKEELGEIG